MMKYVCSVCGYAYDEEKEGAAFSELPSDWRCLVCGAPISAFKAESGVKESGTFKKRIAETGSVGSVKRGPGETRLTAGELSAICSNLARGCEKQYNADGQALFAEMAERFAAAVPPDGKADLAAQTKPVKRNADSDFAEAKALAENVGDRGALRALVWGEKVTMSIAFLLERCEREGTAFLENTEIWVCSICGFVYVGDAPPELCPVCKVPSWKFDKAGRDAV